MAISVDIRKLSFKYGSETILKDISLFIQPKSFISIIGPNGSGKSTLLKNISSVLKPSSGLVKLGEQDVNKMTAREIAKNMAVVPQEGTVDFRFTVLDIVMMGRSPHLRRFQTESLEDYKIARRSMELTDTWRLKDRIINELSGGERQRVIIARALTQEPKIILLDEPTAFLDIQHQIEILELLEKLNREKGLTVITVLHDINLAARFSNTILLLKDGNIIAEGKPEQVITQENFKEAYSVEIIINRNPFSGSPYIIPLTGFKEKKDMKNGRVHLVCGGGTGSALLQKLLEEGYKLTTGALNVGDSDWESSKLCDVEIIEEDPFVGISEEIHQKNLNAIDSSNIVVLTSIPLGYGNLKNLEAVEYALKLGKKVYFLKEYEESRQFDYTKGVGRDILSRLEQNGAITCKTVYQLMEEIKKVEL